MYRILVTAFLTWLHSYAFQWILGIFYSKWSQNPFVRGSYANAEVGTTAADFHNLGGKLGKLYLTGDAVDPDWWGFAQGSYFSGEKKAKEILQCMKNNCELFWPKANVVQEVYTNPWRCSSIQMMIDHCFIRSLNDYFINVYYMIGHIETDCFLFACEFCSFFMWDSWN